MRFAALVLGPKGTVGMRRTSPVDRLPVQHAPAVHDGHSAVKPEFALSKEGGLQAVDFA